MSKIYAKNWLHNKCQDDNQPVFQQALTTACIKKSLLRSASLGLATALMLQAVPTQAEFRPIVERQTLNYVTSLDALTETQELNLDWRRRHADVWFTLPDSDWVKRINLELSAQPLGRVASEHPIFVRLNDGAPVELQSNGQGFLAELTLDSQAINVNANRLQFSYGHPDRNMCLPTFPGQWTLNLAETDLRITAVSRSQTPSFSQFKSWLASPLTQPETVRVKAYGEHRLQLEVLAAQGIARALPKAPDFRTGSSRADMEILLGTFEDIYPLISSQARDNLRTQNGAFIALTRTNPPQLVITAPTQDGLLKATKIFSRFELPLSQKGVISPTQLSLRSPFMPDTRVGRGRTSLASLGDTRFSENWLPEPMHYNFQVSDPSASSVSLHIGVHASPYVARGSAVNVRLNGESLGTIDINDRKNTATLRVPQGLVKGPDNELVLSPNIDATDAKYVCGPEAFPSGLSLTAHSHLKVHTRGDSSSMDLTRLSAAATPFLDAKQAATHVIIGQTRGNNYEATLKLLAHMARLSDQGWESAYIHDIDTRPQILDGHVLILGPASKLGDINFDNAPRAVIDSLKGFSAQDRELKLYSQADIKAPQERAMSTGRLVRGGLVALYPHHTNKNHIIGLISTTPDQNYARAINHLTEKNVWASLEGSVARWDSQAVQLVQTAYPLSLNRSEIALFDMGLISRQWHNLKSSLQARNLFADQDRSQNSRPNVTWPDIPWPNISWPEFNLPQFGQSQTSASRWQGSGNILNVSAKPSELRGSQSPSQLRRNSGPASAQKTNGLAVPSWAGVTSLPQRQTAQQDTTLRPLQTQPSQTQISTARASEKSGMAMPAWLRLSRIEGTSQSSPSHVQPVRTKFDRVLADIGTQTKQHIYKTQMWWAHTAKPALQTHVIKRLPAKVQNSPNLLGALAVIIFLMISSLLFSNPKRRN